MRFSIKFKGGKGSGHFGHAGRPGKVGGSQSGSGSGERTIRESMQQFIDLRGSKREGLKYNSYEQLVLENGRYYEPNNDPLPKGCERGTPKQCFSNSISNMNSNLIYTEGYAMVEGLPMPLAHAWLTTKDGKVVDPTWRDNSPIAYFGVPMTLKFVLDTISRTELAGIIANDWLDDYKLLKNGFPIGSIYKGQP